MARNRLQLTSAARSVEEPFSIIALKDDRLRLELTNPGDARPTQFNKSVTLNRPKVAPEPAKEPQVITIKSAGEYSWNGNNINLAPLEKKSLL